MNVRLYDGTVRCAEHMDASSYQGQTADPCLHCPAGVSLEKTNEFAPWETETLALSCGGVRPNSRPFYPLYGHREGLRRNDLITLASSLFILSLHGGTAHQTPIPGTVGTDGKIVPVNF